MQSISKHLLAATVAAFVLATGSGTPFAKDLPPIKIGLPGANKIFLGAQQVRGAKLAVELINAKGGILGGRKLELLVYDTGFAANEGVAAVQRLINEDGVKLIAGEVFSTNALAEIPVMKSAGALFLATIPKHPAVTESGYDRVLRANSTTTMDIAAFTPALQKAAKGLKVALIAENSEAWVESRSKFKAVFTEPHQVVFDEKYELHQNDFTALITNVKRSGAQFLLLMGSTPEYYSNIIRSAGELGYHPKIALAPGLIFPEAVKVAGQAINGAFSADIYVPNLDNPANREFVAAYLKAYGQKPDKGAELGYEAVMIVAQAAEKAKSADDTALIAKLIRQTKWQLPRGQVTFDEKGQAHGSYYPITVKDGRIEQWD